MAYASNIILAQPGDVPKEARRARLLEEFSRPLTDVWTAERFRDQHRDSLRFVPGVGFITYNSMRWCPDDRGEAVRRMVQTVRSVYADAAELEDTDLRVKVTKHAVRSEQADRIRAALTIAQSLDGMVVPAAMLDRNRELLNTPHGTIDLRTGKLRDHDTADLITKIAGPYAANQKAPTWEWLVSWAFQGRADLVAYFQRACGYLLTGLVREQVWFLPQGNGRNGKTTIFEAIEYAMGDYAVRAMPDLFLGQSGHPTELASLAGARMVLSIEPEIGKAFRDGLLKAVTGEQRMTARRMHKDPFTFDVTFKIVVAANHLPTVRDASDGFWRRVRRLPFDAQVSEQDKDPRLPDKLRNEAPGILAWMVEGAVEWFRSGLGTVPEVEAATRAYREEQDVLRRFVDEECEVQPDAWAKVSGLYERFRAWCDHNGERSPSRAEFSSALLRVDGVREARRNYGRGVQGIALRSRDAVTG